MPKLLVVEDHEDSRAMFASLMEAAGWEVWTAADSRAALEVAREVHLDLLMCDLKLPEVSGTDLLPEIRRIQPRVKAIAVTGLCREEDVERTKAAGFQAHVKKPFEMNHLEDVIGKVMAGAPFQLDQRA